MRLIDLCESIVKSIYGEWAISEPFVKAQKGPLVEIDGEFRHSATHTVTRDGYEVSLTLDDAIWQRASELIHEALASGDLVASAENEAEHLDVEFWKGDEGSHAARTGYFFKSGEHNLIYIDQIQANAFIKWAREYANLFNERYWTVPQVVGWIMTGSPEEVSYYSPFKKGFGARRPDPDKDDDLLVMFSDWDDDWPRRKGYIEATEDLLRHLRRGHLVAKGRETKGAKLAQISPDFWANNIRFIWEGKGHIAREELLPTTDTEQYIELKFDASQARQLWSSVIPVCPSITISEQHEDSYAAHIDEIATNEYWGLIDALMWIKYRNWEVIRERFGEIPADRGECEFRGAIIETEDPDQVESNTIKTFLQACRSGSVTTSGYFNGEGKLEGITTADWSNLQIAVMQHGCPVAKRKVIDYDGLVDVGADKWTDVQVHREKLFEVWPAQVNGGEDSPELATNKVTRKKRGGRNRGRYVSALKKVIKHIGGDNGASLFEGTQRQLHSRVRKALENHNARDVPGSRQGLNNAIRDVAKELWPDQSWDTW